MNLQIKYIGCFFDYREFHEKIGGIRKNPLPNNIKAPHVTFEYKPEKVDTSLFGKQISVIVTGYGNNGENEGLKVLVHSDDPVLQSMIGKIEIPHITIAMCEDGEPFDTRNLQFEDIEPFEMTGIYGGYTEDGKAVLCAAT